jgi:1-deoxy-D-xylulose-5-phosphate synthase
LARLLDRINSPEDLRSLSYDEMETLAAEMREFLVDVVHGIGGGGHLASNLGVVELSIVLHRLFDSPRDKIVWDVSHQIYVHKILTGRKERMATIRQFQGLSGFADRKESEHDSFGAGHAGTAISAAMGMAVARDLKGEDSRVVAVVGDGAMTAGMALEAMNHAGHLREDMTVILNDNDMSISPNVGALSRNVNKLRVDPHYRNAKREIGSLMENLPLGKEVWEAGKRLKAGMRDLLVPASFWEQFGFEYYGPVDGHSLRDLESILADIKKVRGKPVLLHVLTEKGHGIPEAAADPIKSHSGTYWMKKPLDPAAPPPLPTYSQVFAQATQELIESDPKVVAITAAMLEGTGLAPVYKKHPHRVFDVAIAEQHVTFAAGHATQGIKPFAAIYSTFLQRGFDSVVHDVVVQNLPVVFAMDRAGFVGDDGKTHQGFIDVSYLRCLPNMVVAAPKDERELRDLLCTAVLHDGPFAIRYPRGCGPGAPANLPMEQIPIGKAEVPAKAPTSPSSASAPRWRVRTRGSHRRRHRRPCGERPVRQAARRLPDSRLRLQHRGDHHRRRERASGRVRRGRARPPRGSQNGQLLPRLLEHAGRDRRPRSAASDAPDPPGGRNRHRGAREGGARAAPQPSARPQARATLGGDGDVTSAPDPPASLTRYRREIEDALRLAVGDGNDALTQIVRYVMGWETIDGTPAPGGGKRIRPALALLAAGAVGNDPLGAMPGAVAVELVHNFSLVHDEVQDHDRERHHRPTAWAIIGEAQAINAGDFLFTRAVAALIDADGDVAAQMAALQVLNRAIARMIQGQWKDIEFEGRLDVTVGEYLDMVAGKTGALLAAPLEIGALLAGAPARVAAGLGRWGERVGLAFQAQDDYLGTWGDPGLTGKSNTNDIERRKKTLPVVHGLADPDAGAVLRRMYAAEGTPVDIEEVVRALEAAGADVFCREQARRYSAEADQVLADLGLDREATETLRAVGTFLVERAS